jgi:hypothetical protein
MFTRTRHLALAILAIAALPLAAHAGPPGARSFSNSMSRPAPAMVNNSAARMGTITTGISANTLQGLNPNFWWARRLARYQTAYNLGLLTGAYGQMMYGYNPYGYGMMYPMYGGYGSYMSSGYGSGSGYGSSSSYQSRQSYSANQEPYLYISPYDLPAEAKKGNTLAALRKYGGGLDWPIGLRSVTPKDEMSDLRKQIDSKVEALLGQPNDADAAQEATRDLARLKERFASWSVDAPLSSAQRADARRFLGKVEDALKSVGGSNSQAAPKSSYGRKPAYGY